MIVTIDGPAGSGKSTAARNLAAKLKIAHLDTGATYRALTLKALRAGADLANEQTLAQIAREMDLQLIPHGGGTTVLLNGCDVTDEIRSVEVTDNVHYAARSPVVREVLVELQRRIGERLGQFVTEGRDQGSVVFPAADVKFYLIADPRIRAERRYEELRQSGEEISLEEVLSGILERDRKDENRHVAPLIKPEGAIEIDTSGNTIDQTSAELFRRVEALK
ncbi:MAG: (d)CMP kinase [Planctomycetota bacterium]|jgi:cytidylate kinase